MPLPLVYTWRRSRVRFPSQHLEDRTALKDSYDYSSDHHPRHHLLLHDRGGTAAEREGRGSGWSVRRHGITDGVRAARIRDIALQGDPACGGAVHGDVAFIVDPDDARFFEH